MPKPNHTYLRTQQTTKTANQAEQGKLLQQKVEADKRATLFDELLGESRIDKRRLDDLQKQAEALKNFGKEPSDKQGVLLKALGESAKQLKKFAELQSKLKELNSELGVPGKSFVSAYAKVETAASAANVLGAAVAMVAFVMAIKKAASKLGAAR